MNQSKEAGASAAKGREQVRCGRGGRGKVVRSLGVAFHNDVMDRGGTCAREEEGHFFQWDRGY